MDTLNKFRPSLILRKRTTPGDPEGFMPVSRPSQSDKEPIDDAALASIFGSLLWLSLRTRPQVDIGLRTCLLVEPQFLNFLAPSSTRNRNWRPVHGFQPVSSGHHEGNALDVYIDASWSPTGVLTLEGT
eukprot:6242591-Amphidinium_carterae.3